MSRYGRWPIPSQVFFGSLSTLCLGFAVVISSFPLFGTGMGLERQWELPDITAMRRQTAFSKTSDQRRHPMFWLVASPPYWTRDRKAHRRCGAGFPLRRLFFTVAVVQLASLIALWGIRIEKPRRTPTGGRPIGVFFACRCLLSG